MAGFMAMHVALPIVLPSDGTMTEVASPAPRGGGHPLGDQPLARARIMKLSNVYSVTCHQRYWSLRKAA